MENIIVVSALIVQDGKLLIVQEKKKKFYGLWNLPGGMIEDHEDLITALKREVKEEVGLGAEPTAFFGVIQETEFTPDENILRFYFLCEGTGDAKAHDVMDSKWASFNEAKDIPREEMRGRWDLILNDYLAGKTYPLDLIKIS